MASGSTKLPPLPLLRALGLFRDGLAALHRRLIPGHIALLEMQMTGFLAQAINAAAQLGIADALADGPKKPAELARVLDVDEDGLRRLMRLLLSFDVFAERRDGSYALNGISRALSSDAPITLRDMLLFFGSDYHRNHWTHLADAVRTGSAVGPALEGATFFEYAATHREFGDLFDRAMSSIGTLSIDPLLAAYDFGRYRTLVDLGAGQGNLLTAILRRTQSTRGVIFDLPEVVAPLPAELARLGLADRCTVETGSFFESVPKGGDGYILKHIVHDWTDAEAERLLRTVHAAMDPSSTLLIIEMVLPEHHRPHASKFIDLEMLVNAGGRERSESDYRNLLARSGFTLHRTISTAAPDCILEAHPAH
ncbi:hydroxyneurosporene methyltransferase [Nocardia uniformis]|uniref:Hydroxyneurosporene methyltransferase n=1 Tax=Nocardia uniformis TaxID=53432 RepID=A0A849C6I0_9NOCA|nr:methyltransferase [Nocardia uniformis]NNH74284.1 hydroxyneurosporene methyltransferase [Nocardia uniformis]